LAVRTEQEILDFHEKFCEVRQALYRWDVWVPAQRFVGGQIWLGAWSDVLRMRDVIGARSIMEFDDRFR
jgi:hypothetical protein